MIVMGIDWRAGQKGVGFKQCVTYDYMSHMIRLVGIFRNL